MITKGKTNFKISYPQLPPYHLATEQEKQIEISESLINVDILKKNIHGFSGWITVNKEWVI